MGTEPKGGREVAKSGLMEMFEREKIALRKKHLKNLYMKKIKT